MNSSESPIEIRRADGSRNVTEAFAIVTQYYEAFHVIERESLDEFRSHYFGEGTGFWLALAGVGVVGCIGLRDLPDMPGCGEVKRLYVKPEYRKQQIADRLLRALESEAAAFGYRWLYLDSNENFGDALRFYRNHGYVDCERYNTNQQATMFMRKPTHLSRG